MAHMCSTQLRTIERSLGTTTGNGYLRVQLFQRIYSSMTPLTSKTAKPTSTPKTRLLLYAATPDWNMLQQGFYAAEVDGLCREPVVADVQVTNRIADIWKADFDGLVCYFYSYTAFAAVLARIRGRRVIATGGGEQLLRSMAPNLGIYVIRLVFFWLSLLFTDKILATSTEDYQRMLKLGWFRRSAITLSFHGADAVSRVDKVNFVTSRANGSMITICGMDTPENIRRKGLFRAIDLLASLRVSFPEARLTVIGRTTCAEIVRNYASHKRCNDALDLVGYISENEKAARLAAARYYVQLSDYEGFGIGALEALAMGCQVIHSNVGGLIDTIADYGIAVPLDSTIELDPFVAYDIGKWEDFECHMAQFTLAKRAKSILKGLHLA